MRRPVLLFLGAAAVLACGGGAALRAAAASAAPDATGSPPSSPADADFVLKLPSPLALKRGQPGQDPSANSDGIRRETFQRASIAAYGTNDPTAPDSPEDKQLAALAQKDQDFLAALNKNPNTWPEAERDRRAQEINDAYGDYLNDHPSDVNALVLYGKFLRRMGEREKSYAVFQHAHQLNPRVAVIKQQIGGYLAEEGKYAEALGFFVQAVSLAPKEPLYHYQLAELLNIYYDHFLADNIYTQETLNKAIVDEFKQAALLAPTEPGYAWRAAECYYDLLDPDWKAALAAWEELGKHTTSGVELEIIRLHRARVLLELGRKDDARVLLEQPVRPVLEASRKELIDRLTGAPAPTPAPELPSPAVPATPPALPAAESPPAVAPATASPPAPAPAASTGLQP